QMCFSFLFSLLNHCFLVLVNPHCNPVDGPPQQPANRHRKPSLSLRDEIMSNEFETLDNHIDWICENLYSGWNDERRSRILPLVTWLEAQLRLFASGNIMSHRPSS